MRFETEIGELTADVPRVDARNDATQVGFRPELARVLAPSAE